MAAKTIDLAIKPSAVQHHKNGITYTRVSLAADSHHMNFNNFSLPALFPPRSQRCTTGQARQLSNFRLSQEATSISGIVTNVFAPELQCRSNDNEDETSADPGLTRNTVPRVCLFLTKALVLYIADNLS